MFFRLIALFSVLTLFACASDYSSQYFDMSKQAMKSASVDDALKAYEKSVKHNPHSPDYYNARGDIYYNYGRYGEAVNDYTQSLRNDTSSEVNLKRGRAYMKLRYFKDASIDFTSVIDRHNQYMYTAYVERAKAYIELGMHKEALRDLEKTKKRSGDSLELNIALGEVYIKLNDPDKAKEYVQKALIMDPENAEMYLLRGKLYYKTKDANQAISDMKTALEKDPSLSGAKLELARIYATCPLEIYRDGKKAVEMAREIYEISNDLNALIVLAAGYAEMGDFKKAISLLDSRIEGTKDYVMQDDMRVYKRAYEENRTITGW
ncbi:MAG: tetratricopeptide repeat protein [Deferribacterales bacterium]